MMQEVRGKVGRIYPISEEIKTYHFRMTTQDIVQWKRAIETARSRHHPRRRYLIELYDNIIIDGHLEGVLDKRLNAVMNKKIIFTNKQGDVQDKVIEDFCDTPFMRSFIEAAMKSIPYGFSLIELYRDGIYPAVNDLERANVRPEDNFLMWNVDDYTHGFNFKTDKLFAKNLLFVGGKKTYGKLFTAAQYVIFKRGGWSDWAQFAELYGMPLKEGRYDPWDPKSKDALHQAFIEMGGNPHVILPRGSELILHDVNSQGKSEIFKDLIHEANAEISKIFLGNTLTTEAGDKGARALGTIHADVEHDVNLSDMIRMEYVLNWELIDKLRGLGYPIPEGKFSFDQAREIPLEERIKIDEKINNAIPLSEDYWKNNYGVEFAENREGKIDLKKKTVALSSDVEALYAAACDDCKTASITADVDAYEVILTNLAKAIWEGREPITAPLYARIVNDLTAAVLSNAVDDADTSTIAELTQLLRDNVAVFSAAKTKAQLQAVTSLLTDAAGQFNSFTEFFTQVKALNIKFNENYLQAEYNHAVASTQTAYAYRNALKNGGGTLAQYRTAMDERVRADHRPLHNVTKPLTDDFWKTYWPPNGWGCRCKVTQMASGEVTPDSEIMAPELPAMFRNNPGINGIIFPSSHPYFDAK